MPSYRIEISPNARAMCKNKECKDAGIKIQKGEARFGTLITIEEHTSWTYKHWGCVTPAQIANLQEFCGGDTDMVDGYDEVPADIQEKIRFALENGHVPDEDWKGDVEVNRPGQKGFRVKAKAPKKKGKKTGEDEASADEGPKPQKKRGRPAKDDGDAGEQDAPAPKKAKGKGKKAVVKQDEAVEDDTPKPKEAVAKQEEDAVEEDPKPKKARAKKPAAKKEKAGDDTLKPKTARAKRTTAKVVDYDDDAENSEEADVEIEVAPKAKRGRKKAAAADDEEKPAPQKRGRKKKAVAEDE